MQDFRLHSGPMPLDEGPTGSRIGTVPRLKQPLLAVALGQMTAGAVVVVNCCSLLAVLCSLFSVLFPWPCSPRQPCRSCWQGPFRTPTPPAVSGSTRENMALASLPALQPPASPELVHTPPPFAPTRTRHTPFDDGNQLQLPHPMAHGWWRLLTGSQRQDRDA